MISGFGSGSTNYYHHDSNTKHAHDLPLPFNIPKVLHNLLYEDVDLEFDNKQEDMLETLRFSFKSLIKMQHDSLVKESEFRSKILEDPDNEQLKNEHENMLLERQQAHFDFKHLVEIMSDMMTKEQMITLLRFSNLPV